MPATTRHLILLVPGLAGPESDPPISDYLVPRPRELDRWFTRSRRTAVAGTGLDATLCRWFGLDPQSPLPVAALSWLADCPDAPPQYLLRADPVHLRADQRYLRLFEGHSIHVNTGEAEQLVAAINAFNQARGWQLSAPHPQRWYLRLPAMPQLVTHAPQQAAGADIDPFLPGGQEARQWHALFNELQMLLHDHPVNRSRLARGEPAINSLWFWGNGSLPPVLTPACTALCADHPVARGLARQAGIPCEPVPATLAQWQEKPAPLVVLEALEWAHCYRDVETWLESFEHLERDWLRPAVQALRTGELTSLTLEPCNGWRFTSGRWRQFRFWQTPVHFEERCAA